MAFHFLEAKYDLKTVFFHAYRTQFNSNIARPKKFLLFLSADSEWPLYGRILAKRSRLKLKTFPACIRFLDDPVSFKISVTYNIESLTISSITAASEPSSKSAKLDLFVAKFNFSSKSASSAFSSQNLIFPASKFALVLSFSLIVLNSARIRPPLQKTVALTDSGSLKDWLVVYGLYRFFSLLSCCGFFLCDVMSVY